ncbi:hypothetical protein ACKI2N_015705 [Cupriavidus sp. 30B13]|uniref:hypothetical protein n=1 Tax=Cupriavidus sp. 30B13 TaxID=3384241 RepID=UPI003B90F3A5
MQQTPLAADRTKPVEAPCSAATFTPRFAPGQVLATPAALAALAQANVTPQSLLRRHLCGDWGDLDELDHQQNNFALAMSARLLSSYALPGGGKVWVITEADRSVTTVLLPEDY